jgi:hypothetical protein
MDLPQLRRYCTDSPVRPPQPEWLAALARICVNRTHPIAFNDRQLGGSLTWAERHALKSPHLPQGSPCSPALANLCAYRLDLHADDLAFSGGAVFARSAERFHIQVAAIAMEEGFLAGRIAYVKMVNADRAAKLRRLLDAIAWPA